MSDCIELMVHSTMSHLPVADKKLQELATETNQDYQIQARKDFILSGWPDSRKQCFKHVLQYWNHGD